MAKGCNTASEACAFAVVRQSDVSCTHLGWNAQEGNNKQVLKVGDEAISIDVKQPEEVTDLIISAVNFGMAQ